MYDINFLFVYGTIEPGYLKLKYVVYASHCQTLSHNVISSTPRRERD
jgi:hypothetical protein